MQYWLQLQAVSMTATVDRKFKSKKHGNQFTIALIKKNCIILKTKVRFQIPQIVDEK